MREMAALSYFGGKVDFKFYKAFNNMCNRVMQNVLEDMKEFEVLPIEDQRKLLSVNLHLANRFKTSMCIEEETSCMLKGIECCTKSGE